MKNEQLSVPDSNLMISQSEPLVPERIVTASQVRPEVEQFLDRPKLLTPTEKKEGYRLARQEAAMDGGKNKVVVELGGKNYWGKEYPNLFSFDDALRGNFEQWEEVTDENERSPQISSQAIAGPGGESTHAFFETDDGHMYTIRRTAETADEKSAAKQEFEIISTTAHLGKEDNKIVTRKVSSEQLKGVFARPGEPLVLGNDPDTGKPLRTRGNITRITTMRKKDSGEVPAAHKILNDPNKRRDTPGQFLEALRQARQLEVASRIGPLAITEQLPVESEVGRDKEPDAEEDNPLSSEQQNALNLKRAAEFGADFLQSEGKTSFDAQQQAETFTASTTEHIRLMHQQAAAEGRSLNVDEKSIVQGLMSAIKTSDAVVSVLQAREGPKY